MHTKPSVNFSLITSTLVLAFLMFPRVSHAEVPLEGKYVLEMDSSKVIQVWIENEIRRVETVRYQLGSGRKLGEYELEYLSKVGLYVDGVLLDEETVKTTVPTYVKEGVKTRKSFNITEIEIIDGKFEYFPSNGTNTYPSRICEVRAVNEYDGLICPRKGYDDMLGIIKATEKDESIIVSIKLNDGLEAVYVKTKD